MRQPVAVVVVVGSDSSVPITKLVVVVFVVELAVVVVFVVELVVVVVFVVELVVVVVSLTEFIVVNVSQWSSLLFQECS